MAATGPYKFVTPSLRERLLYVTAVSTLKPPVVLIVVVAVSEAEAKQKPEAA
jgi:hypothetical protein